MLSRGWSGHLPTSAGRSQGQQQQLHWRGGDTSEVVLGRRENGTGNGDAEGCRETHYTADTCRIHGGVCGATGALCEVSRKAGPRMCAGADVGERPGSSWALGRGQGHATVVTGGGLGTQKARMLGGGETRGLPLNFPVKFGNEGRGGVRGVTVGPVRGPCGRGPRSAQQQASPRNGDTPA